MNKEDWKKVASDSLGKRNSKEENSLNCDEPALCLKIKGSNSWWNSPGEENKFFSGKMLNFYEDTTKNKLPLIIFN